MRDIFPGFYGRTEDELSRLWQEGVFVFDTNMLLNVYRYNQQTRDRYFEILDILKKGNQLWIPYQVAYEYQSRRIDVIQSQLIAYTDVSNILQTTSQNLADSLEKYKSKHGFIDTAKIIEEITTVIKSSEDTVKNSRSKDKREFETLKKNDKHLRTLEELFQGIIGKPYNSSELEEFYKKAQLRVELKIPPGWEDIGKKSFKMYGDIILWFQLVDYARIRKRPIVFITDDAKKDWWLSNSTQETTRPLPDLVQEMFIEANIIFHMYKGFEFMEVAENFLKLEKKPDVIADAKEVTQQNILELNQVVDQVKHRAGGLIILDQASHQRLLVKSAVADWLKRWINVKVLLPSNPSNFGTDRILVEPGGAKTAVHVEYKSSPFLASDVRGVIEVFLLYLRKTNYDKLLLILVCKDMEDAAQTLVTLNEKIVIPPNLTIMVGYLEDGTIYRPFGQYLE